MSMNVNVAINDMARAISSDARIAPAADAARKNSDATSSVTKKDADPAAKELSPKTLESIASEVQTQLKRLNTEVRFEVDKKSDQVVIKILDQSSNQVIRQIPSEELLAIRERMDELIGVLYKGQS